LFVGFDKSSEELKLPSHNIWITNDESSNFFIKLKIGRKKYLEGDGTNNFAGYFVGFPSAKDKTYSKRFPNKSTMVLITGIFYCFKSFIETGNFLKN
jgi:all-trans-retinol 13,14-reductase